jgi:microcystin-dependent protein
MSFMSARTLVFVAACATAVRAFAAAPVPNTFTAGTPAKAAEVNANFTSVVNQIGAVETNVAAVQGQVTTVNANVATVQGNVSTLQSQVSALQAQLAALQDKLVPTGTILPFTGTAIPAGFLACDGAAVSRTQYAALFAIVGVSFGQGDQITTFNVPDLRGRFLRGVDGSAGNDPDKVSRTASGAGGATGNAIGSFQASAFASHVHGLNDPGHIHHLSGGGSCGCGVDGADLTQAWPNSPHNSDPSVTGVSIQATGGSGETRPVNIYVGWIIKT